MAFAVLPHGLCCPCDSLLTCLRIYAKIAQSLGRWGRKRYSRTPCEGKLAFLSLLIDNNSLGYYKSNALSLLPLRVVPDL